MSLIRFENVEVIQEGHSLLQEITFRIEEGDKTVIHGTSGAGKSSLLYTILGVYPPNSGSYLYQEEEVTAKNIGRIRRTLSFVGQNPTLGAPTVEEALLLPFTFRANRGRKPQKARLEEILDMVKLEPALLERNCDRLSGGERQRVAIARELLLKKKLFILDEVTSALDRVSKAAVGNLFHKDEYTIISVSHDDEWIEQCNKKIRLEKGKIAEIIES